MEAESARLEAKALGWRPSLFGWRTELDAKAFGSEELLFQMGQSGDCRTWTAQTAIEEFVDRIGPLDEMRRCVVRS